jgi:hypothetical protein
MSTNPSENPMESGLLELLTNPRLPINQWKIIIYCLRTHSILIWKEVGRVDPGYIDKLAKAISDLVEGHNTIFLQTMHHRIDIENFDG